MIKNKRKNLIGPLHNTQRKRFIDKALLNIAMFYNILHVISISDPQAVQINQNDEESIYEYDPITLNHAKIYVKGTQWLKFEGPVKNSYPHGENCKIYTEFNNIEYEGSMKNGLRHGQGTQYFFGARKILYHGNFTNNFPEGDNCTLFGQFENIIYQGGIYNGELNGYGERYYHTKNQ